MLTNREDKIKTRDALVQISQDLRATSKIVGYTSGVFDLLHPGHVDYLERARARCDVLIVGVNADVSVRFNKGPSRPICPEADRLQVVAALGCVDFVFLFDDKNNNRNVELLKPHIYFKAGDYAPEKLSSAPLVEQYGGRVEIIPMQPGLSSSAIIDRVIDIHIASAHGTIAVPRRAKRPAVFLDRDGTLCEEVSYLHEPSKFRLIPGTMDGLKKLAQAGYLIVVVTNQPGVGLGYFKIEDVFAVNRELLKAASRAGVMVEKIYFCPHSEAEYCPCRKPATGLVTRAVEELNVDLSQSIMIGDMTTDVMLAKNAGIGSVLVRTGAGGRDGRFPVSADHIADNVAAAAEWILARPRPSVALEPAPGAPRPLTRESLEAIGQFGAKVGHDVNNFLSAIRGCLDMVKRKVGQGQNLAGALDKQMAIMERSVARCADFTGKIRGFVRPGPIERIPQKLSPIIQRAVTFLTEHGVPVVVNVEGDPLVAVHEFSIEQILIALSLNALEAMQGIADRDVVIHLDQVAEAPGLGRGRYCRVSVMDHGKGLDRELQQQVFLPFFTTKPSTPGQSMGLSLVMAREVLRKHEGAINLSSRAGCGTVVQLFLPLYEQ